MNKDIGKLTTTQAISRFGAPAYERSEPNTGRTVMVWQQRQVTTTHPTGLELGAARRGFMPYREVTTESVSSLIIGFERGVMIWWRSK